MPGLIGIISDKEEHNLFRNMIKSMNHFSYNVNEYMKNGIHLARVHLNYITVQLQPISNKEKTILLLFHGEIFSFADEIKPANIDNASYFLSLFEKKGINILDKLNGHFSACIYLKDEKTTYLISDRFGLLPLYYSLHNNRLIFASEVKAIIKDIQKRELNYHSISELFSIGHLFGNKTLFENIHQVPSSSYIKYSDKNLQVKKYWDYNYDEKIYIKSKINHKEYKNLLEELKFNIIKAVQRMSGNVDDILFSLSGGLDSRYVVALFDHLGYKDLTAFTVGFPGSEDLTYALKVVKLLNINHHKFETNPYQLWKDASHYSYLSDGMSMIQGSLQGYQPNKFYFEKKKIHVCMQMCDALFGSSLWKKKIKILKENTILNTSTENIILNIFNVYDKNLVKFLFNKESFKNIKGLFEIEPSKYLNKAFHPLHIYYKLLMNEHGRRGTLGGNLVINLFYQTRMPSFDNDLFDFGWNLPIAYREHQYLYRMTFASLFPELSKIKREGYNLKINASNFRYDLKTVENKIAVIANNSPLHFLTKHYKPWNRPEYVNYKNWFRSELSKQLYDFFNNQKIESTQLIDLENVRKIVNLHISGAKDYSGIIWQLINLEYFYQNFISN